jgi:hypothetical protein
MNDIALLILGMNQKHEPIEAVKQGAKIGMIVNPTLTLSARNSDI